jgi:hypothetical protein
MIPMSKTLIIFITFIWVLNINVWRCLLLMLYLACIFKLLYVVGELHKVLLFISWLMSTLKMLKARCLDYLPAFKNNITNGCEHIQLFFFEKMVECHFHCKSLVFWFIDWVSQNHSWIYLYDPNVYFFRFQLLSTKLTRPNNLLWAIPPRPWRTSDRPPIRK